MEVALKSFASFDGCEICFSDDGGGAPTILLHAFIIESGMNWHATGISAALVESGRRVICPDLRGHGDSDHPHDASAYANNAMARDVIRLIDVLQLVEVHLVGYSMGSCVAIQVAANDSRVKSLVLGGVGIGEAEPTDPENMAKEIASLRETNTGSPGFYRQIADSECADRLAIAARLEGDTFPQFTRELVEQIEIPTTIINGQDDFHSPQELASWFKNGSHITCNGDHISVIWEADFAQAIIQSLGA